MCRFEGKLSWGEVLNDTDIGYGKHYNYAITWETEVLGNELMYSSHITF